MPEKPQITFEKISGKKIAVECGVKSAVHGARKELLKAVYEKPVTPTFPFALADIIELASPTEGISSFIEEYPELLGAPTMVGNERCYNPLRVNALIKSWKGESGKSWRRENGFESYEEQSINAEEVISKNSGQDSSGGQDKSDNQEEDKEEGSDENGE